MRRTHRLSKSLIVVLLATLVATLFSGWAQAAVTVTVTTNLYQRPDGRNRYHQTQTFLGSISGHDTTRFDAADVGDLGANVFRLYTDMSQYEPQDDDGVYGSPSIAEIKANPNLVPWSFWDTQLTQETCCPVTNIPVTFEQMISGLQQHGAEPVINLVIRNELNDPQWIPAVPTTQADFNEWWEFSFALAYWLNVRHNYRITYFEILNEPNGGDFGGTVDQYAQVLDVAYDALHFVNDGLGLPVHVMAPNDINGGWLASIFQRRDAEIDIADYHDYGGQDATGQDAYARGHWDAVLSITTRLSRTTRLHVNLRCFA